MECTRLVMTMEESCKAYPWQLVRAAMAIVTTTVTHHLARGAVPAATAEAVFTPLHRAAMEILVIVGQHLPIIAAVVAAIVRSILVAAVDPERPRKAEPALGITELWILKAACWTIMKYKAITNNEAVMTDEATMNYDLFSSWSTWHFTWSYVDVLLEDFFFLLFMHSHAGRACTASGEVCLIALGALEEILLSFMFHYGKRAPNDPVSRRYIHLQP